MLNNKKLLLIIMLILVMGVFFVTKNHSYKKDSSTTLKIAIMGEPTTLDPNYTTFSWENIVLTDIFSGLLGKNAKGESIPEMAESWEINEDGSIYTFKLRDSKWSDGTPVTAYDFVYAYKRILNPNNSAPYADMLYIIKGAEGYNNGKLDAESLKVTALDDKTLIIELEYPASYFLSMLHHYTFFPIPKHTVEEYGNDWSSLGNIVTNGAYKITEWDNTQIVATKNEFYYGSSEVKIENIIYCTEVDRDIILKKFRSKEIDIARDFDSSKYEWVLKNLSGQYDVFPYVGLYYFSINIKNRKLSDIRVREAINLSIDRDFITNKVLKSGEIPAYSIVPEGIKNYRPAELSFKSMSKTIRIEKAKHLLKEAGYSTSKPLEVEISYNTGEQNKKITIAVANMLKEVGINATISDTDIKNHYNNMQKGNYQIGRAGWISDYDDPLSFLYIGETGVLTNYAKFSNKHYDKLLEKAKKISKEAKRNEYYRQAEKELLESSSYIPIYYYVSKSLVSNRLQGFMSNITNIHPSKYIFFKETK